METMGRRTDEAGVIKTIRETNMRLGLVTDNCDLDGILYLRFSLVLQI
jgi:hypothetical protein